jgi:hypothetical protein
MGRKAVVGVCVDSVMLCAGLIERVDVHGDLTEIPYMMEELMADLCGDGMSLGHR